MKIFVTNAPNTSDLLPPSQYDSWIDYWETRTGIYLDEQTQYECPLCKKGALRSEMNGCHVEKLSDGGHKLYIIPGCDHCNPKKKVFKVDESLLVPVP